VVPPTPPSRNWRFLTRPFWLFSHLFALGVVVLFVFLGQWQLQRLDDRREQNAVVEERSLAAPISVADALALPLADADTDARLDYLAVADTGVFVDDEIVRVANRSQNGAAGDWAIATFVTDDGVTLLVNRGFLTRDDLAAPASDGAISGWLRASQEREGQFGGVDDGEAERVPRLDVAAIAERVDAGADVAPVWLQLAPTGSAAVPPAEGTVVPEPVPLPPIDEGSHLSYALQWFTFAVMGTAAYVLVVWRKSVDRPAPEVDSVVEGAPPVSIDRLSEDGVKR
jgi:surfeit locus 1 family protein